MDSILKFLGCGASFNPTLGNTCAYFIKSNNLYLIDCGELVFRELYLHNMLTQSNDIYIIITHMHADHVGSLGSLISYTYFVLHKKVHIMYPSIALQKLLDLMGITKEAYIIHVCEQMVIDGVFIDAIPVHHVNDMDCYGYRISDTGNTIYYSGDSYEIPDGVIQDFLEGKIQLIYQDTTTQVSNHRSHLPLSELKKLIPPEFRYRVFCMHFNSDFTKELQKLGFHSAHNLVEN